MCKGPVGLGANLTLTSFMMDNIVAAKVVNLHETDKNIIFAENFIPWKTITN